MNIIRLSNLKTTKEKKKKKLEKEEKLKLKKKNKMLINQFIIFLLHVISSFQF